MAVGKAYAGRALAENFRAWVDEGELPEFGKTPVPGPQCGDDGQVATGAIPPPNAIR